MTASVKVEDAGSHSAIKLPLTAIFEKSGHTMVWLVDAKTALVAPHKVALGSVQGDTVLITEGLNGGEIVVTTGVHMLTEGQKVLAKQISAESAGVAR
jgi:multidrug efflux pump subunit AcrA (membrane-fusion protein)